MSEKTQPAQSTGTAAVDGFDVQQGTAAVGEGLELVGAFVKIVDPAVRRRILTMVAATAASQRR